MAKALQDELKARAPKAEKLCEAGRELMNAGHPQTNEIASRIDSLENHWKELRVLVEQRRNRLTEAAEAYQVKHLKKKNIFRRWAAVVLTAGILKVLC